MNDPSPKQLPGARFAVGDRVAGHGDTGRVQSMGPAPAGLRYLVKWDKGPTTWHLEAELRAAEVPPQYP